MTRTHKIKLDGYGAHTTLADDRPVMLLGTAESYGIEMLHIVPGKDWAELTITATFNASDGSSTDILMATDGNVVVPSEATAKSGSGRIVFTGVSDGIQRISCDLDYFVVAHSAINGAQSGGVAPSWFEQAVTRFMPTGGTAGQVLTKLTDTDFDAEWQDSKGGEGGGGTNDHSQLINRDIADQHPISAITGLEEALTPLTGTTETLTPTQVYDAIKSGKSVVLKHTDFLFSFASFNIVEGDKAVVSTSIVKYGGGYFVVSLAGFAGSNEWVFNMTEMAEADNIPVAVNNALAQAKESGEFDGADGQPGENGADGYSPTANVTQNDNGATITITDKNGTTTATVTNGNPGADGSPGADGADGKSAYAYAVDGGYTGTEEEFAAKLAQEKFVNPNALTFTGAVTGSYDGSEPLTVEIPGGGGAEAEHMEIISEGTLSEDVANIAADGFSKRMIALAVAPYGSAANSGNIKVRLQLGLDNGESLTINPNLNFVTNTAAVSWNKIVAFAFVDTDTVDVTVCRDGISADTDIFMSSTPSSNTWLTKQVYTGVEKITSVSIGLQSDGVIGKNTAYKVVGA